MLRSSFRNVRSAQRHHVTTNIPSQLEAWHKGGTRPTIIPIKMH